MNVFVVSIVTQQERKSNMRIRNGFIGSGFGEPGSLPPLPLSPSKNSQEYSLLPGG